MSAACVPGPPPAPTGDPVECIGVPQEACAAIVSEAGRHATAQRALLVEVRIRCTNVTGCTDEFGEASYEAVLSNGSTVSSGYGWQAAGAPPMGGVDEPDGGPAIPAEPPVPPTCLGVPAGWCREMAAGMSSDTNVPVVSIVVRCTTACTDTNGEGETTVTFADGTIQEGGWGYEGPPP